MNELQNNCNRFIDNGGCFELCNRLKHYQEGNGPNHGWQQWGCPNCKRPVEEQNGAVAESDCAPTHYIGCHKTKSNGLPVIVPKDINANTTGGDLHLCCPCRCVIGQPMRNNNGEFMDDPERKRVLRILGLVSDASNPENVPTKRKRTLTSKAAIIASKNAVVLKNNAVAAAVEAGVTITATVLDGKCMGIGQACTRTQETKSGVLAGLCKTCTLLALKTVATAAKVYYDGDDDDDDESMAPLPQWLTNIIDFLAKRKHPIAETRCHYCKMITELRKLTIELQVQ